MPLREGTTAEVGPLLSTKDAAVAIDNFGEFDSKAQQCSVHLQMTVASYKQQVDEHDASSDFEWYVVADLGAGSAVLPGNETDDDENRGYFTHGVDVRFWFDDAAWALDTEAPSPSSATGSGSASTSTSTSVGFFGDQLTATGSWSSSQGGGRSYQDYETECHSSHANNLGGSEKLFQSVLLKLCDGGPYRTPLSLVNSDQYLNGLPPRASGNLPLLSAAAFRSVHAVKQDPPVATMHVSITIWMAKVVWWATLSDVKHWAKAPDLGGKTPQLVGAGRGVTVEEYDLTKGPGMYPMETAGVATGAYIALPWSHEFTWTTTIDFANKKVSTT